MLAGELVATLYLFQSAVIFGACGLPIMPLLPKLVKLLRLNPPGNWYRYVPLTFPLSPRTGTA